MKPKSKKQIRRDQRRSEGHRHTGNTRAKRATNKAVRQEMKAAIERMQVEERQA